MTRSEHQRAAGTSRRRPRRAPERGAVLIMLSLLIVPLCIVTATVVDLGFVRTQRAALQNAADSAAVAAGNLLSASGSRQANGDGLPQAACTQALASLRQNVGDFTSADVDDPGGCAGNLPGLVSACITAGGATSTSLTATSGSVSATLTYPVPLATDQAAQRVTFVRSGSATSGVTSAASRCRSMLVTLKRTDIGPFFARFLSSSGQSVSVRSIGATIDPGYSTATTVPGATTTTSTTSTTLPPDVGANFVMQHTIFGSDCASVVGVPNAEAPYLVPGLTSPSATQLTMNGCSNIFSWVQAQVWTAYGIGSNGDGTVVVVGDQDRFARFVGCSSSASLTAGSITQTNEGWVGRGGSIFYDVTGSGTRWVAVGSAGQVRVSTNDGQSWHNAAQSPATAAPLTEVATDGNGTWMAASNSPSTGQLFRSTDNGETWTTVTGISGSALVRTVAWDGAAHVWLAAGSLGSVWQSSTGAQGTWGSPVAFLHDSGSGGDDLASITASPTGTVLVAAAGYGRVYRATVPGGPYTSSGSSITWAAIPERVRFGSNHQAMLVGLNNQVWYSTDDGVNWAKLTSGMPTARTWDDVAACAVGGQ